MIILLHIVLYLSIVPSLKKYFAFFWMDREEWWNRSGKTSIPGSSTVSFMVTDPLHKMTSMFVICTSIQKNGHDDRYIK